LFGRLKTLKYRAIFAKGRTMPSSGSDPKSKEDIKVEEKPFVAF